MSQGAQPAADVEELASAEGPLALSERGKKFEAHTKGL